MPRRNRPAHRAPARNLSARARAARNRYADELEPPAPPRSRNRFVCVNGKVGFETEGQARAELDRIRARDNSRRKSVPVRVYRCEKCPLWHLTSRASPPVPPSSGSTGG